MEAKITYNMKPKTEGELNQILDAEGDFEAEKEAALSEVIGRATVAKRTDLLAGIIERIKRIAGPSKITLARLFKLFLEVVGAADDDKRDVELQVSNEVLAWATRENKAFLRTKLIVRVAELHYLRGEILKAREMISPIVAEATAVDDKALLIEVQLLEAKILASWGDWAKAKSALSSCRAAGAKIYVAPSLQAEIDSVAGTIHLAEKDYAIACSYFVESLEGFHQQGDKVRAARSFRHLLLAKILMGSHVEAQALVDGKHGEAHARVDDTSIGLVEILQAVKERNLVRLSAILNDKADALKRDAVIFSHLEDLYGQLLEKNILKLLAPYSRIELSRLSEKLEVGMDIIERKLCEMILDQKLKGSIDQEQGILILIPDDAPSAVFQSSLNIISSLDLAVDALLERSKKIREVGA
jgi:26S proteasome regulatory subunit N6